MEVPDQILDATTRLMGAHGFSGTTVQAIADEVGIRKASVLYHFPNKDALRSGVLERVMSRWNEVLPRLMMATSLTGVERFDAVMVEILHFFAADADRARVLVREMLDRPEAMKAYLLQFVRPWMEVVARYIDKGQRAGEIWPEVDPPAYILQACVICLSATATAHCFSVALSEDSEQGRKRFLEEMVRLCRRGLFSPTPLPVSPSPRAPQDDHG